MKLCEGRFDAFFQFFKKLRCNPSAGKTNDLAIFPKELKVVSEVLRRAIETPAKSFGLRPLCAGLRNQFNELDSAHDELIDCRS